MQWEEVIWPIWILASVSSACCIISLFWLAIDVIQYSLKIMINPNYPENARDKKKAGFLKLRIKVSLWASYFFPGLTIFVGIFVSKSTELLSMLNSENSDPEEIDQSQVNRLIVICNFFIVYLLSVCWYTQCMIKSITKLAAETLEYYNNTNSSIAGNSNRDRNRNFHTET